MQWNNWQLSPHFKLCVHLTDWQCEEFKNMLQVLLSSHQNIVWIKGFSAFQKEILNKSIRASKTTQNWPNRFILQNVTFRSSLLVESLTLTDYALTDYALTDYALTDYALTIPSLCTHYTLTMYSLCTHYTLTIPSLYPHYALTIHSQTVTL